MPLDKQFIAGEELPEGIGAKTDLYKKTMALRLAMEKEAKKVKERETEISKAIIAECEENNENGGVGENFKSELVKKEVPIVEDWEAFHAYIQEQNRFDLLQKRMSDKAVAEMLEDGEEIPGINTMISKKLSVTKR